LNFDLKREAMKKLAALSLSLFLTSGIAFADSPKDSDPAPAKKASSEKAKEAKKSDKSDKSDSAIAAEIEELRQTLQSQQEQLQLLKEELSRRDRQIDEAREAAAAANSRANEANVKASEAVTTSAAARSASATTASNTVASSAAEPVAAAAPVVAQQAHDPSDPKSKPTEDGPASIQYKGVSLTPGGFFAAETIFRSRAISADINTPFNSIPFSGNSLSRVSENNFTARQSRPTMLVETNIGPAKVSGYFEADFLGAGTTSNNRQTNSYVFRQRQLWAQVAFSSGLQITGGQMWSLATESKKGIQNRQEALPLIIDPQYVVGFTWQRAYGFRVAQTFFDNKFAVGISVEGPQTTVGGRGFSAFTNAAGTTSQNFFLNAPGNSGGLYNAFDPTGYTANKAPDFVAKITADPGWGHYELLGIISTFRARVYPCAVVSPKASTATTILVGAPLSCGAAPTATAPSAAGAFNDSQIGGGIGASATVPLVPKKVDIGLKVVAGDGIGRFGSAQIPDVTARPTGTLALIRTGHAIARLEFHPNPKLDLYAYVGDEYGARTAYKGYSSARLTTNTLTGAAPGAPVTTTTTVTTSIGGIGGYGSPFANNSGCSTEVAPVNQNTPGTGGTCAGDTRNIIEGTAGFWYRFYNGSKGRVQWGMQYAYFTKSAWSGNNNVPTAFTIDPKAVDNMVWTSFRYYLP
jgi:hypothetical protein